MLCVTIGALKRRWSHTPSAQHARLHSRQPCVCPPAPMDRRHSAGTKPRIPAAAPHELLMFSWVWFSLLMWFCCRIALIKGKAPQPSSPSPSMSVFPSAALHGKIAIAWMVVLPPHTTQQLLCPECTSQGTSPLCEPTSQLNIFKNHRLPWQ